MFRHTAVLGCLMVVPMCGQPGAFDAESVRVVNPASHPVFGNRGGPGTNDPGRIHLCCVGMFSLVMRAYGVELDQISGPAWIMDNMGPVLYEVDATMPATTTRAEFQLMMQNLLEKRFHLQAHRERRNFPGYALTIAEGGPKIKESKRGAAGPQMLTSLGWGVMTVQSRQKPLSDLVQAMGRMINQSLGEHPNDYESPKARVIDRTGLAGIYDFTLRFSCELCQFAATNGAVAPPAPQPADSPGGEPSLFTALQKQLGLKLVKIRDVPLDVIVIDQADKIPTAN